MRNDAVFVKTTPQGLRGAGLRRAFFNEMAAFS